MINDPIDEIWQRFSLARQRPLYNRWPGYYRSLVVETNDPLNFRRVRFKCPELHNFDISDDQAPWAVPAPWLGGKNAGSFTHPIIGDIVWISFEKGHPYGPIWCGFAMGTRRRRYPLESIYTRSPLSVKEDGTPAEVPEDFDEDFLPKDNRPMSTGMRDRYGSFDLISSVGYFPIEHDKEPASLGQDAVNQKSFDVGEKPEVNNPDLKYMARCSKYGGYMLIHDGGYFWKKDGDLGEFEGDFDKDIDFEIKRSQYLQKLFNENEPKTEFFDQRRMEWRTRAGHKVELRDVGWAQSGGAISGSERLEGPTKSRPGEYDDEGRVLSNYDISDERWMKFRTKGGHLIQLMDTGFHPEEDEFYKRLLTDEVGSTTDGEKDNWTDRDARMMRLVTRHGFKFVLDDRGSDPREAEKKENPHGNGWLLKTRRRGDPSDDPDLVGDPGNVQRGFGFEANDKDELNTSRWYSAKSKIIEINDAKDYIIFATDTATEISEEWRKLSENEFAAKIAMTEDPEQDTYHMKLDKFNGYLRLKTSGGNDNGRRGGDNFQDVDDPGINQGMEARDGRVGQDGAWVELVDRDDRGLWFSRNEGLAALRSSDDQFIVISDSKNMITIVNNRNGPLQVIGSGNIELISQSNIALRASNGKISLDAAEIVLNASGSQLVARAGGVGTNVPMNAPTFNGFLPGAFPGNGAQGPVTFSSSPVSPSAPFTGQIKPTDRGETDGDYDEVDLNIIRGQE